MFEERLRRSNPSRFAWESQTPDNLHLEDLDEDRIKGAVAYGVDRGRMPASAMTESTWGLLDKFAMTDNGKIKNAAQQQHCSSSVLQPILSSCFAWLGSKVLRKKSSLTT